MYAYHGQNRSQDVDFLASCDVVGLSYVVSRLTTRLQMKRPFAMPDRGATIVLTLSLSLPKATIASIIAVDARSISMSSFAFRGGKRVNFSWPLSLNALLEKDAVAGRLTPLCHWHVIDNLRTCAKERRRKQFLHAPTKQFDFDTCIVKCSEDSAPLHSVRQPWDTIITLSHPSPFASFPN